MSKLNDAIRDAIRDAADWLAYNTPQRGMTEAGRLTAAHTAAHAAHPDREQAANELIKQLLQHMPEVDRHAVTRGQYSADLHALSWRI